MIPSVTYDIHGFISIRKAVCLKWIGTPFWNNFMDRQHWKRVLCRVHKISKGILYTPSDACDRKLRVIMLIKTTVVPILITHFESFQYVYIL
jgi:hypothetical protein